VHRPRPGTAAALGAAGEAWFGGRGGARPCRGKRARARRCSSTESRVLAQLGAGAWRRIQGQSGARRIGLLAACTLAVPSLEVDWLAAHQSSALRCAPVTPPRAAWYGAALRPVQPPAAGLPAGLSKSGQKSLPRRIFSTAWCDLHLTGVVAKARATIRQIQRSGLFSCLKHGKIYHSLCRIST